MLCVDFMLIVNFTKICVIFFMRIFIDISTTYKRGYNVDLDLVYNLNAVHFVISMKSLQFALIYFLSNLVNLLKNKT